MWRPSSFPANQDSDQSISDVEEFEFRCSERCVSLDGPSKREQPNLALQFELLSGGIKVKERRKLISEEKNAGFSSEDEVEMPIFNKDAFDVEKNNDENDYDGSAAAASWSKVHEKLISDVKQHTKFKGMSFTEGGRVRNQPSSFHGEPYHQQAVRHSIPAEEALDSPEPPQFGESLMPVEEYDSLEEAAANPVEGLKGKCVHESEDAVAAKGFGGHECAKHSMADLLDGLQEKNFGQYAIPKRVGRKGRKRKVVIDRNSSLAIVANDEDPCEVIDSGSSCDNESKYRTAGHTTSKAKKKTMADQFQEALGATSVNEGALFLMTKQSRACSSGLLGKFQKVIQREKEQDLDFLKNLHSEALGDEAGYIDVKILSRSFEAKLTACLCSIHGYKKSSGLKEESEEERLMNTRTIIFSSRTCSDVKLDAGSYVRVCPPWKEVKVLGGNVIILATYFTQTST